jgi:molecular chaperone GrpE
MLKNYMSELKENNNVPSNQEREEVNNNEEIEGAEMEEGKSENTLYKDLKEEEMRSFLRERDEQVEELRKEAEETKEALLRKVADLDNYRKRVQHERSKVYDTAKANALKDFLGISDDLARTLEAAEELDVNQTFLKGVSLVAEKFDEVLKKEGVERINEEGVPFDVDLHDALMRKKPEDNSVESNTVLKVVENGYKIGERTIRHAKVIVSE